VKEDGVQGKKRKRRGRRRRSSREREREGDKDLKRSHMFGQQKIQKNGRKIILIIG